MASARDKIKKEKEKKKKGEKKKRPSQRNAGAERCVQRRSSQGLGPAMAAADGTPQHPARRGPGAVRTPPAGSGAAFRPRRFAAPSPGYARALATRRGVRGAARAGGGALSPAPRRRAAGRGRISEPGAAGRGRLCRPPTLCSREPPAGSSAEPNGALPGGDVGRAAKRWGQVRGHRRQRGARAAPAGAAESSGAAGGAAPSAVRGSRRRGAAAAAPARSGSSSSLRGIATGERGARSRRWTVRRG